MGLLSLLPHQTRRPCVSAPSCFAPLRVDLLLSLCPPLTDLYISPLHLDTGSIGLEEACVVTIESYTALAPDGQSASSEQAVSLAQEVLRILADMLNTEQSASPLLLRIRSGGSYFDLPPGQRTPMDIPAMFQAADDARAAFENERQAQMQLEAHKVNQPHPSQAAGARAAGGGGGGGAAHAGGSGLSAVRVGVGLAHAAAHGHGHGHADRAAADGSPHAGGQGTAFGGAGENHQRESGGSASHHQHHQAASGAAASASAASVSSAVAPSSSSQPHPSQHHPPKRPSSESTHQVELSGNLLHLDIGPNGPLQRPPSPGGQRRSADGARDRPVADWGAGPGERMYGAFPGAHRNGVPVLPPLISRAPMPTFSASRPLSGRNTAEGSAAAPHVSALYQPGIQGEVRRPNSPAALLLRSQHGASSTGSGAQRSQSTGADYFARLAAKQGAAAHGAALGNTPSPPFLAARPQAPPAGAGRTQSTGAAVFAKAASAAVARDAVAAFASVTESAASSTRIHDPPGGSSGRGAPAAARCGDSDVAGDLGGPAVSNRSHSGASASSPGAPAAAHPHPPSGAPPSGRPTHHNLSGPPSPTPQPAGGDPHADSSQHHQHHHHRHHGQEVGAGEMHYDFIDSLKRHLRELPPSPPRN